MPLNTQIPDVGHQADLNTRCISGWPEAHSCFPAGCCTDGGEISVIDYGNGTCTSYLAAAQPCTRPLFGKRVCKSIQCPVNIFFDLSNGSPEKTNMQQYLDMLGIGSVEYIPTLNIQTEAQSRGLAFAPVFFTGLKWVRSASP